MSWTSRTELSSTHTKFKNPSGLYLLHLVYDCDKIVRVVIFQGARLPITVQEIINLPMDEFNDLLSKHELSEDQLTLCRDIRRRGKNKVGVNCAS